MECSVSTCDSPARTRGLCNRHYLRMQRYGDVATTRKVPQYAADASCSVAGCSTAPLARHLCRSHYERMRKYGDPLGGLFRNPTPALRTPRLSFEERFWSKVDRSGAGCWIWQATRTNRVDGYGAIRVDGRMTVAHRVAYELLVGPIPEGMELDHRCRTRLCVNPAHLEPVTKYVNFARGHSPAARNARKTHCLRGHLLSGENLAIVNGGRSRRCRQCKSDNGKERWRRVVSARTSSGSGKARAQS